METLNGRRADTLESPTWTGGSSPVTNAIPSSGSSTTARRPCLAFLKLRATFDGPAYLLESAEQGPARPVLLPRLQAATARSRWSLATRATPTRRRCRARSSGVPGSTCPTGMPPFPGGAVGFFGYDLVRTVERLAEPNPDPLGLPDMGLMVCELMLVFDHLRHEVSVVAFPFGGPTRRRLIARRGPRFADPFRRSSPAGRPRSRGVRVQPDAGGVRGERRADRRVRPRRRCLPGGAVAAFLGRGAGRGVLDLSRASDGQPVALHVLPRLRATSRSPAPRRSR